MRKPRKIRRTRKTRVGAGYVSISPFVDRKVFQYSINLLQSGYSKTKTENMFAYLIELLGYEEIEHVLKVNFSREEISVRQKCMDLWDEEYPSDFEELKRIYSTSQTAQLLKTDILPILQNYHQKYDQESLTDKKLLELKKIFNLTPTDLEIISYKFTAAQSNIFNEAFEGNITNLGEKSPFFNNAWKILNISKSGVMKSLRRGNLIKCQLLDLDRCFDMADWLEDYLSGLDNDPNEIFFTKAKESALPLESHLMKKPELDVLNQFLTMPAGKNFLFYGEPGTGKTELAKSLASHNQRELFIINNKDKDRELSVAMKTSIIASCNILNPKTSTILVDEADDLLNTQYSFLFSGEKNNKSWINQFLDQTRHKIIWITNRSTEIEPSTMRRFDFSMKFKRFNLKKKLHVFKYCLRKKDLTKFFSEEEIRSFCGRYSINAGGISSALNNLNIRKTSRKARIMERLDTLLKNHETAITGKEHKGERMKDLGNYNLGALNTSEKLDTVLTTVGKFIDRQSRLDDGKRANLNILLYGIPGSGKTEFVKYLGKELKREIVLKRASDLVSCWVGQTEQNIAQAFDEAEENQSILFLDEADSFLSPRESARNSWEKTEVNELLTQMEGFNGVLACATNFLKGLDQAALRRFKFKIEFLPLAPEGNLEMYQTIIQPLIKGKVVSQKEESEIMNLINLTPGDFHVVAEKFSYVDKPITHRELIASLFNEAQFKPKSGNIGFGNQG